MIDRLNQSGIGSWISVLFNIELFGLTKAGQDTRLFGLRPVVGHLISTDTN